jgi:chlorite dismutase
MPSPLLVTFSAGATGAWRMDRVLPVRGETLPAARRIAVLEGSVVPPAGTAWSLRGVTSNVRYATKGEMQTMAGVQEGLGRPAATCAALIPIRKSEAWWTLAQDERRRIFEETSRHTAIGLEYLPAVARRLHHSRDLGEPFDFLTWFEFAPEQTGAFDDLVRRLRATEEWAYVEREVDIRLSR